MDGCLIHQLYQLLQAGPVSIEILPASWSPSSPNPHEPFEFAEKNLGIPKRVFYQVYGEAIKRFDVYLASGVDVPDKERLKRFLEVTCIILLVNPAHSTCLNRRKLVVEAGLLHETEELKTTAALQLRPEGAKSSILWHHRRWLLRRIYGIHFETKETSQTADSLEDSSLSVDAFATEISVAASAGEIYPRNYHAWLHRFKCLQSMAANYRRALGTSSSATNKDSIAQILRSEEFTVSNWLGRNVSDYTAAQYLCHLYAAMREESIDHMQVHAEGGPDDTVPNNLDQKSPFSPLNHAIDLIGRYPTHESLWYYLRTAYANEPNDTRSIQQLQEMEGAYADHFRRWRSGLPLVDCPSHVI